MANNKKFNYVDSMVKLYGEDWIVAVRPEDIQKSARRIVKDMVKGNIDYEKYGKYFLDPKFMENLLIAISNELETNSLYYNAVAFYMGAFPQIPNIQAQLNHLECVCYIYNILMQKLTAVKESNNIGYLVDVPAMLGKYRNHLN